MKRPLKRPHPSVPGPRPQSPVESQKAAARLAFTLLELLIAIAIIAILASLILTVAGAASQRARQAQVSTDIANLSAAISGFKTRFGVDPPSSIFLYETAAGWNNTSDPNAVRSMGLIKQIWPQFDFNYGSYTGNAVDINGNGTTTDIISLSGAECLVFFLGGIPASAGGAPMGFSQNPGDPFNVHTISGVRTVVGTNREKFGDFDVSRLFLYPPANQTITVNTASVLLHSMNTYKDTFSNQTQPYLYLSSYGGQGYIINELVGFPSPVGGGINAANAPGGTFIDVYRQGPQGYWPQTLSSPYQPESSQTVGTTLNPATPSPPWNASGYQIISPGGDGLYGVGGEYETANGATLLTVYGPASPATTQPVNRTGERDNITNFSGGIMAP
jgi:prepilin-type N-terminal cleavage/methylation domain-containing protein